MRRSLLASLSLLAACGTDDAPAPTTPADEIAYELFPSTRMLVEADLAAITNVATDGTITFASEPAGIATGQVLLGGIGPKTPEGLLRFVTGVTRGPAGEVVVETSAAPIQAAFRKLHVKAYRTASATETPPEIKDLSPLGLRPQLTLASGRGDKTQSYEIVIFDGDGDTKTTNDQVKIEATLGGGFTYDVAIDLDWGIVDKLPEVVGQCLAAVAKIVTGEKPTCNPADLLPEAKSTFRVDPFVTLDAKATGSASLAYEKDLDVGVVQLPPFALGPIVFTPSVDVLAHVEGGASARFEVTARARADFESSLVVSSKDAGNPRFESPRLKSFDAGADPPVIDLHANAEVSIGTRLNVPAFGMIGPYAKVSGVARIGASPFDNPCFKVGLGIEAELGIRITSPRLPGIGYITLADATTGPLPIVGKDVASGACVVPPEPPRAPGTGPGAAAYRAPTFTPYAKDLGGAVDMLSTYGYPDLSPTVDGRYLLSGESSLALHKLDPNGTATWTARFGDGLRTSRVLRSVPTRDGGVLVLLRPESTDAFVLAKLGQSGALVWTRAYVADESCTPVVTGLGRDDRGYVVLGECRPDKGFFARIDDAGQVVRARIYAEPGASRTRPSLATTTDGDLVLAGDVARPNELGWTFITRLDAEDRPTSATAFYCPDRIEMQPLAVVPAERGGVTVVGTANGLGFVARVTKENTLGFVKYPNVGVGVASDLAISSVAELPTTGMVVGATALDLGSTERNTVVLAGLDAGGSTLWARRYTWPGKPVRFPALRLTDDGGVFFGAIAEGAATPEARLVAAKVFAKDGFLGEGQALVSTPIALTDTACATTSRTLAPTMTDFSLTARETPVTKQP